MDSRGGAWPCSYFFDAKKITHFEGLAETVRRGTFRMTEEQALDIIRAAMGVVKPKAERHDTDQRICNITQACDYIGISQPTFRKRIREGKIPAGHKIAGFTELVWYKKDIEEYAHKLHTKQITIK